MPEDIAKVLTVLTFGECYLVGGACDYFKLLYYDI